MARSRSRSRSARSSGGNRQTVSERIVVQMPRQARAPTRRAAPRASAPIVVRARRSVRHHASQVGVPSMIGTALAGYILGAVDKGTFPLPTLPVLGRAGTIALAAGLFAKKHPLIAKLAIAASAISGYELGRNGVISGEDSIMGGVASQV